MDHRTRQVIRTRLKEKGWDQSELARQLGLSGPTVSRVLSGPLLRPESHWPAILNALGLELAVQPRKAGQGETYENAHEHGA